MGLRTTSRSGYCPGDKAMQREVRHGEKPEALREKLIILVVDGDPVSQFYTCIFLQRLNYHVISVRTAEEALVIMELTTPLIVITEVILQRMSGVDLLKHVKQDPRMRNVPVLIYTSVKAEAQRGLCQAAGCAGYLVHTSDHNTLYEAIQQATEQNPRHFIRLKTWLDVIVTAPGSGDQNALMSAVSEHGMFVITQQPLLNRTTAMFTLYLPNAGANGIRLQGKVLYSHAAPGPGKNPGMGVKFLQVRPADGAMIKAFIKNSLMSGIVTDRHAS
jgi:CheY-like chemotaxis protein/Tfp pilus assembly protein PilZ